MSQTQPENLVACFRSTSSILQSFDGTRNALDINEVKRFSPEIFVKYSASMLQAYIDGFYKSLDLCINCKYTFNKNSEIDSPLEALVFVISNKNELSSSVIDELRHVVDYGLSLTQESSDLFDSSDNTAQLSKEAAEFVEEFAHSFLEKNGGKNISKPFEWTIGGSNASFIPFQGRIRTGFNKEKPDGSEFTFTAKLDGFKGSDMLIYLHIIDTELKKLTSSVSCVAEKSSLIKSAAEIYSNSSPAYVTVTAFQKADEKGVIRFHMQDISSFEFDELTELSVSN